MNWVDMRNACLLAEDHAVFFNCLSLINVGKSGFVKFGAGVCETVFRMHFSTFLRCYLVL